MLFGGKRLHNQDEAQVPVTFIDKEKGYNPVTFLDQNVNGEARFVINRFTENGAYVRNNLLYFKMNDVEIYTSLNNIIMVDTIAKTFFVKEFDTKITDNVNPVDPEKRQYIVLYMELGANPDDTILRWEAYDGRTNTIEALKVNAPVIDIDKSIVITENVPFKEALSVRKFFNYLQNADIITEEEFDINDYSGSEDYNEDDY